MSNAKLILEGKEYELPVVVGSENEVGIDIAPLRAKTGAITLDPGYVNTGVVQERDHLHRRRARASSATAAIPIEQLAEHATLRRGRLPPDLRRAAERRPSSTRSATS